MCIRGNEIGIVSFEGREGKREMEKERERQKGKKQREGKRREVKRNGYKDGRAGSRRLVNAGH